MCCTESQVGTFGAYNNMQHYVQRMNLLNDPVNNIYVYIECTQYNVYMNIEQIGAPNFEKSPRRRRDERLVKI